LTDAFSNEASTAQDESQHCKEKKAPAKHFNHTKISFQPTYNQGCAVRGKNQTLTFPKFPTPTP